MLVTAIDDWDTFKLDDYITVGGDGGCGVGDSVLPLAKLEPGPGDQ